MGEPTQEGRERVRRAERLLREHGLPTARIRAVGPAGEIASLLVPDGEWERVLNEKGVLLAERIKALGFRYVALNLEPPADPGR